MLPGCVTDLGCIFLMSLAAPDLTLVTVTAWSLVTYPGSDQALRGRTIRPALGPPFLSPEPKLADLVGDRLPARWFLSRRVPTP